MKFFIKFCLYLLVLSPIVSLAQNTSNKGDDFWVGFPAHGDGTRADMFFYITADSSTTGTVSIPGQSWSSNFTVTANKMTLVTIPTNAAYVGCNDCIEAKGIHVVSNKPIVVYSHIYYRWRSDATLVLPTRTTGKEYYVMSYGQNGPSADRSQFMIIGSKDDTKIRITPTTDLQGKSGTLSAGSPYEITLDEGEVYQGRAKGRSFTDDVTGTHIEVIDTGSNAGCKTVAVFSGSSNCFIGCSSSGGGISSRDNLYQQLYPSKSWGSRYVTIPFKGRKEDNIRILASEDNTSVIVNHESGAPSVISLDAGEFYQMTDISETKYILASGPISVAQFQESQKCGGKGDPSMTILNPIEQTLKGITVYSTEYEDIDDHYINVIIPTSAASTFRIDGSSVTFKKVPKLQSHSYVQITVTDGNHQLKADKGFIAIAYGFGRYESYGYAAGANVKDLTAKLELVNSAELDANSICLGDEAEFEGQAEYKVSKWEWDFGDGNTDTGQYAEHTYSDTGTFNVWLYTYKTAFDGCSTYDSAELEMRVNAKPIADFTTSLKCEASTVNFTDASTTSPGNDILSRQWIFHNSGTYATNTSKYYDTAGTFNVKLITKTIYQCTDTANLDMVINPNPEPDITVSDVCFKDSSKLINSSTVQSGTVDYSKWYFGDGDSSLVLNPTHFYQDSGYFYVTLIATTDSGCSASVMDTFYKHPSFTLDFTHTDTCAGLEVNFTNTSFTTGGTLGNYGWEFPGGVTYATTNALHKFTGTGTFNIELKATQNNFCTDSIEHQVTVDPLVSADFTHTGICMNDSITFINTSTVASGTVSTAVWDLDDGFTATGDTVKVRYTSNGSKDIEMIAVSDAGCADTTTQQISIIDPKITSFTFPVVCEGQSARIYSTQTLDGDTIDTYSWDVQGFSSNNDTLTFVTSVTGKYIVDLVATTKRGCTISHRDSFTAYSVPNADFDVSDACEGFDLKPTNNSTIGNGETIASDIWHYNGTLESFDKNPTITATPAGPSTLLLIVTSGEGCSDQITKNFDVFAVPSAGFTLMNTCLAETTDFTSTSSISSGSIASYTWEFDDGTNDVGNSISRTYASDGSYSVKHVVISDNGCPDSMTQNFAIHPKPILDISADPLTACAPALINFNDNSSITSGTIDTYDWDWGDGNTGNGSQLPLSTVYSIPGTYQVTVYATSDQGCKDTLMLSSMIDILATPVANFSYTPLEPSLLFPDVNFANTSSSDATSFDWSTGDGGSYTTQNVTHKYQGAGDYDVMLIVTADNGCKDTMTQLLTVKLDFFIWIPNVFSPNGDQLNDVFRVHGIIPDIEGYTIQIFNRWGEIVFETDDPNLSWDGKYQEAEVFEGIYGYRVRYINYETGRWESKKGSIKIIR